MPRPRLSPSHHIPLLMCPTLLTDMCTPTHPRWFRELEQVTCAQAVTSPNPGTAITSRLQEATTLNLKTPLLLGPLPTPAMRPLPPLPRMEPATLHRQSTPFPAEPATLHRRSILSPAEPATRHPQSTPSPAKPAIRHRQSTLCPAKPITRHPQSTTSPVKPHTVIAQAPTWRLFHHLAITSERVRAIPRVQAAPVQNTFPSQLDTTTKSRAALSAPRWFLFVSDEKRSVLSRGISIRTGAGGSQRSLFWWLLNG